MTFNRIRRHIVNEYLWHRVLHLPDKVFDATVDTHVLIFERASTKTRLTSGHLAVDVRRTGKIAASHALSWESLDRGGAPINVVHPPAHQKVIEHVRNVSIDLIQVMTCFNGIKPFEKGKGTPPQTSDIVARKPYVHEGNCPGNEWSPLLRGSLIRRYQVLWSNDYWIKYGPWLAALRDPAIFTSKSKIMVRQTGDSLIAAIVPAGFYARNNMHIILPKSERTNVPFILALLNSKLMDFVYSYINPEKGEALAEVKKHHLEHLPIPDLQDDNPGVISLGKKAEQMSSLLAKRAGATSEHETNVLSGEIKALASQIDKAIYALYRLDQSQILLVEEFASQQTSGLLAKSE